MAKGKKRAGKLAEVAERSLQRDFDSFMKVAREEAERGASLATLSSFGYDEGRVRTLKRMFEREGFKFKKKGGSFEVRW